MKLKSMKANSNMATKVDNKSKMFMEASTAINNKLLKSFNDGVSQYAKIESLPRKSMLVRKMNNITLELNIKEM